MAWTRFAATRRQIATYENGCSWIPLISHFVGSEISKVLLIWPDMRSRRGAQSGEVSDEEVGNWIPVCKPLISRSFVVGNDPYATLSVLKCRGRNALGQCIPILQGIPLMQLQSCIIVRQARSRWFGLIKA